MQPEPVRAGVRRAIRWLLNIPTAALPLHDVLHYAAEKVFTRLLEQDDRALARTFLLDVQKAHPTLQMYRALPQLVRAAQPAARDDAEFAHMLLVLGAEHLPAAAFQGMLRDPDLTRHFPADFRAALDTLRATRARQRRPACWSAPENRSAAWGR